MPQTTRARSRSWMFSAPTTRRSSSTTSSALILCASISCAASTASASAPIVFGERVITDAIGVARRSMRGIVERAAQVAVGVQAEQAAVGIDHRGHAQALAAHLDQRFAERRGFAHARHVVAGVHDVADVQQQAPAERAGRMRAREIFGGEAARFEQRDRERIAQRQRGGGAGGRRERERAGFGGHAGVQVHVGFARERRTGAAGHRDERVALALEHRQQRQQLVAFARVGQREHDVGVGDHAEVAVAGFARMHEEAGVPVEARVAAILRATWPDLPMPVHTTRPRQASISLAGRGEGTVEPRRRPPRGPGPRWPMTRRPLAAKSKSASWAGGGLDWESPWMRMLRGRRKTGGGVPLD